MYGTKPKNSTKIKSKIKNRGAVHKKTKWGRGRGESPDANWNLLKKSRVNTYIFFWPTTWGINITKYQLSLEIKKYLYIIFYKPIWHYINNRCFISSKVDMLEFNTKADLLRRLWKYSKDVRLVDRMMKRWEVVYEDHVYKLVPRKDVNSLIDLVMSFCDTDEERVKIREVIKKILYNNNK